MKDESLQEVQVLEEVQSRVLWLAVRMIDHANRERPNIDGIKVGGHQASSASLVSALTALYFHYLNAEDRVSVKPHASPAFHSIQYLLGNLDRSYLTTLRSKGGLQSYPSRTKDPDEVDFSTGSVGLGVAAPLFAATTRRYVDAHFGDRPPLALSPCSVMPNSTKEIFGKQSQITQPKASEMSCGLSTSIANLWTEWFLVLG